MNILLQDKATLKYVDNKGEWTDKHDLARNFASGYEALCFCASAGLRHAQMLCEFKDGRLNFAVPVTDAQIMVLKDAEAKGATDTIPGITPLEGQSKPWRI